ncbi:MAG: prepilin-type N-terminal cleavage/methylation domain-containing protein [Proteobacteria bacterium]|nr:prepilin-type N-terminal cleavage/methylation domain-containing protein [Pseudomonadota bacterium]
MLVHQMSDLNKKINNRGFSIIEVIFALSIFAIGIMAVSTLSISSINSNASARRLTDATALAEDRLERLTAMPYDDIADGQATEGAYKITWVVIENDIVDKTKSITVTVNCPNGWKNTNVAIRHLISKNS